MTSARPIISAEAVEAVRAGFRVALSRARIPGAPPIARAGRAEHGGERADDPRRVHRDAEEEQQHADAEQQQARPGRDAAAERAERDEHDRERRARSSEVTGPYLREPRDGGRTEPSRTAAIGGTRVARRAGRMLATSVTSVPTSSETITVRVAKIVWPCGRSIPKVTKSAFSTFARPSPRNSPMSEPSDADHERLDNDRPEDLAAGGAQRAQRRELAHPLSDRDRERVRDHERADEERDPGECQQDVLEERDEAQVLLVLLDLGVRVAHDLPWRAAAA